MILQIGNGCVSVGSATVTRDSVLGFMRARTVRVFFGCERTPFSTRRMDQVVISESRGRRDLVGASLGVIM